MCGCLRSFIAASSSCFKSSNYVLNRDSLLSDSLPCKIISTSDALSSSSMGITRIRCPCTSFVGNCLFKMVFQFPTGTYFTRTSVGDNFPLSDDFYIFPLYQSFSGILHKTRGYPTVLSCNFRHFITKISILKHL